MILSPGLAAASPTVAQTPPRATLPPAAEQADIMRVAGFVRRGNTWVGCSGQSRGTIEAGDLRHINGDGLPEAFVTASGSACHGMAGQGFVLLTRGQNGQWRLVHAASGIPTVMTTVANGWPDIQVGGPGFCHPVLRWNGRAYAQNRVVEEQRGACARR